MTETKKTDIGAVLGLILGPDLIIDRGRAHDLVHVRDHAHALRGSILFFSNSSEICDASMLIFLSGNICNLSLNFAPPFKFVWSRGHHYVKR